MKMRLQVTDDYGYVPVDDDGVKYTYNRKAGDIIDCELVLQRNYKWHKKAMSLVKVVHEQLPEPKPIKFRGQVLKPIRTFDMTRKYLTVQAGYYDVFYTPTDEVRVEAKSWKFNKMSPETFEKFYSDLIDACLKSLPSTWSEEELERVAREIIAYV